MNEARALTMLCIHFSLHQRKTWGCLNIKKVMHDAQKIYASVHKSGHSGGPTILNGENREFLSSRGSARVIFSHEA